ncbi:DUF4123 domain-containing protein [Vibrio viridaestus]|uniref:DUF4123 domain-containing protein n=1 Tax=Vibrio viridaestus TaxID=2487322 RepID=A0A3N9TJ94_9VIBR|nr:DUF4123 domain-containing protein [Vibrio viridaestus]RQW63625.1 DUF4123 domain-containing protein [Vibrio viridaestus]
MRDLNSDLNWYVILNSTSDCNPQNEFYQRNGTRVHQIWKGTPYAEWNDLMPLIAQVDREHEFLSWALESQDDWGMLVGSKHDLEDVLAHFRSLTQVWVPSDTHAFFRFYDPDFGIRIARYCNDSQRAELMGPTCEWVSKGQRVINLFPADTVQEKEFPWWNVPKEVMDRYTLEDKTTFITNCIKWLKENHADLYFYFPQRTIEAKVEHLVRRYTKTKNMTINEYIFQALSLEVYR